MIDVSILSKFYVSNMVLEYLIEEKTRLVGLRLHPSSLENQLADHRETIHWEGARDWTVLWDLDGQIASI